MVRRARSSHQRGSHGSGKTDTRHGEEPLACSAPHRNRRGHPGVFPTCCHQCRHRLRPLLLFFSEAWRRRKEKHEAKIPRKGKKKKAFSERPPVPPRSWNKSVPLYAGMWKERRGSSILLKVWTGTCWSWVKVRTFGRDLPDGFEMQSPVLVRRGAQWWLHTSMEKTFTSPPKIAEHMTNAETRICAVDLNLDQHLAVCTVQTVEGTILATRFIGEGRAISGFRNETVRTDRTPPITDWHHRGERTGQCRPLAQDPPHG